MADEIVFYNSGSLEFDPGTGNEHRTVRRRDRNQRGGQRGSVEQSKTSLTTIWRNEDNKVDAFNGPTWWLADFVSSGWLEPLGLGDDHMSKFPDSVLHKAA